MNWMAHFALSPPQFELQLGNLVADAITIDEWKGVPQKVALGMRLHQEIDHVSDHHPAFRNVKSLISVERAALKPVVVDILFDYHLHKEWERFHHQTLDSLWTAFLHQYDQSGKFPYEVDSLVSLVREHDLFESYATYGGVKHALFRIERRLQRRGRSIDLQNSIASMEEHEQSISDSFVNLYADLQKHCREWLTLNGF